MANVFTFAAKDAKRLDALMDREWETWRACEEMYDDEHGVAETANGMPVRLWAKRSWDELRREWTTYVAPAKRMELDAVLRAQAKKTMVRGWEYQAMMCEARAEVAERLGITGLRGERAYFVTVRPDPRRANFDEFYAACAKWLRRKPIGRYLCSFEQKGTTEQCLGDGFHFHAIIWVSATNKTWGDKATILRDTQNTFKSMAAPNCIEVAYLAQARDVNQTTSYLTDHTSADGHKEETATWDAQWRANMGLPMQPTDDLPMQRHLPIKSNRQVTISMGDAGPSYTVEEAP